MTPLQRYIAEEIATDHVDGLFSRREALRRLALIGVGATAASTLIAACSTTEKPVADAPVTSSGPATEKSPPPGIENEIATAPVTWAGPRGDLQGAWAAAAAPKGAVLVIHENKGLTDWVRSVAGRFAGIGYSALAVDLLSAEGGTAAFKDPAEATGALSKISPQDFVADMKSAVGELQRRAPGVKVAAVGFCMGGGLVWQLLASGEPQLAAAVPFYGPLPDGADFSGSKGAAVLALLRLRGRAGHGHQGRRQGRRSTRPDWSTNSSSSRAPITRSSTTPATATTRRPPPTPGRRSRTGSPSTSARAGTGGVTYSPPIQLTVHLPFATAHALPL